MGHGHFDTCIKERERERERERETPLDWFPPKDDSSDISELMQDDLFEFKLP